MAIWLRMKQAGRDSEVTINLDHVEAIFDSAGQAMLGMTSGESITVETPYESLMDMLKRDLR